MYNINEINEKIKKLEGFSESFKLLNYIIQPHVMHINRGLAGSRTNLHSHRTFECSLIISGKINYHIANQDFNFTEGDAVIIPPGTYHTWTASSDVLIFGFMLFISSHGDGSRENLVKLQSSISRHNFRIKNFKEMNSIFLQIIDEIDNMNTGHDEKIQCLSREIYVELMRRMLPEHSTTHHMFRLPPQRGDKHASIVDLIRFYVQDNISRTIKLQEISNYLGVSMFQMCKVFKNKTGETIQQLVTRARLSESCKLLKNTDRPLKDIASAVGYENPDYYCRVFKKYKGITPSQFRKNL